MHRAAGNADCGVQGRNEPPQIQLAAIRPVAQVAGQERLDVRVLLDALDLDRLPQVHGNADGQGLGVLRGILAGGCHSEVSFSARCRHDAVNSTRIDCLTATDLYYLTSNLQDDFAI